MENHHVKMKYSLKAIKDVGKLTDDGVCVYDLEQQRFKYVNKRFLEIFDTSRIEVDSMSYRVVKQWMKHDLDYIGRHLSDLRRQGKIENIEFRLKSKNDDKFISVDAFMLNDGHFLLAKIRDVSVAKQHDDYIIEFGARKDALLDMVARNLSSPLNLMTELINSVDQMNKSQQYKKIDLQTRLIRETTQQCIEVINSFLREEHSQSENIAVKNHLFDANAKVNIIVDRLREFNSDKKLTMVSNTKELMVRCDDVKFFQVIHNLLSNAVKFTPSGGEVGVRTNSEEHFFEVVVADSGIGIPEHLQPYIFQRNTPAARDGLRGEKSIGMGLYIVKKLVHLMHGQLTFTSKENNGTTFIVRLPKE